MIMKALRYLLVAIALMLASLPVGAQYTQVNSLSGCTTFGQTDRQYNFRSTSPMLKADEASLTAPLFGAASADKPTPATASGPRRSRPDDWEAPQENPIGDGMWVMLLLAFGYAFGKLRHGWHAVP